MKNALAFFVMFYCVMTVPAFADSIFDENWKDDKQPTRVQPSPPTVPPPIFPRPARPPSPDPIPSQTVPAPQPPQPSPQPDSVEALASQTRDAVNKAKFLSQQYLQKAEGEVIAALERSPEYLSAKVMADHAMTRLENARRNGSAQEKLSASSSYNNASAKERHLRESALAASPAYQEAKDMEKIAFPAVAGSMDDDARKKEVAAAITRRDLLEGMTYDEVCRAARTKGTLYSYQSGTTVYRWNVNAKVGSHKVLTESHISRNTGTMKREYADVPDYRVIGYVEATFTDGKLATYRRYSSGYSSMAQ